MSERTVEVVRAELREVQRQIMAFGSFASRAEQLEGVLAYFTDVSERIDPFRLREIFGNDALAWQAADDLTAIQVLLRNQELANRSESLTVCLRGLVRRLREREKALEQELAALEPPPPPALLPWDMLLEKVRFARRGWR